MRDYYSIARAAYYKSGCRFKPEVVEDIIQEAVILLWEVDDGIMEERYLQYKATYIMIDAIRLVLGNPRFRFKHHSKLEVPVSEVRVVGGYTDTHPRLLLGSIPELTEREEMLLEALLEGSTMRQVAKDNDCTEANVSMHLRNFRNKLTEAVYEV